MLRAVLNKSWKQHPTKEQLYGNIPAISTIIRERRTRFAGHCFRNKAELASELILWKPTHGYAHAGRPRLTYIDQLARDVGLRVEDLKNAMGDREVWKERVDLVRASSPR